MFWQSNKILKCKLYLVLLSLSVSLVAMDNASGPFFRVDPDNDDESSAIKTYSLGDIKIVLAAVHHAAEVPYYERLNALIKNKVVIYESIEMTWQDTIRQAQKLKELSDDYQAINAHLNIMHNNNFRKLLNLPIQTEQIDYSLAVESIHGDFPMPDQHRQNFEKKLTESAFLKHLIYRSAITKFNLPGPSSLSMLTENEQAVALLTKLIVQRIKMASHYEKIFGSLELGSLTISQQIIIDHDVQAGTLYVEAAKDCLLDLLCDQIIHTIRQIMDIGNQFSLKMYKKSFDYQQERLILDNTLQNHALKRCPNQSCEECALIHPRNEKACICLDQVLNREKAPKEIVMFFGLAHAFGIEVFLFKKGAKLENIEWVKNISGERLRKAK